MTAPTGRIDAAFGWSGHRLREGRGASCRGGWRPPRTRRRPRRVARRSSPSPTRLHVPALAQPVRRPEGGRRQGPVRPGSATRYGPCRRQHAEKRPASRTTNWSLRRFQGVRSCAQEIECSPQRRVALGIGQHSTDSLTFLVAEDFPRARFALDHCASNRHRDVGQALLSKPPREFLDLFRSA
jgi:hypothetical protein